MRVKVDTAKCTGHAQCNASGPDVYDLDEMGYSVPLDAEIPAELEQQARDGAAACPERAITIIE